MFMQGSVLEIIVINAVVILVLRDWLHEDYHHIKKLSSLQALCEGNPWLPGIPLTKG